MRLLYWLPAAVLALATCAADDAPSDPPSDVPNDGTSEPAGEGIVVDADVFKSLDLFNPHVDNSTTAANVAQDMLLALSSTSASPVACNGGEASTHVLVGLSGCFSKDEMNSILGKIASSVVTDQGNKFFKDGAEITRKFYWAWYTDGTCSPNYSGVGHVNIAALQSTDTTFYTFVNVAKDKGISVADALGKLSGKTFASSLGLRVCSNQDCPSVTTDTTVANVNSFSSAKMDIVYAMHCGALPSSVPKQYQISTVKQCKCECKGPLALGADGKCSPCKGGRVYSEAESACVCPEGTTLSGDACVPVCVWKGPKVCSWSSADKTDLKLLADCGVLAPVAKDNYVADRRVNQNDPSGNTDPTTRPLITITAQEGTSPVIKATSTWYNYVQSPGVLENKVALDSFGVFNLKMDASDYRKDVTCEGCVAVVDNYRPTPINPCGSSDARPNTCEFSQTKLTNIITDEAKFTGFYAATNVKNNNAGDDNERDDLKERSITDFFTTSSADSSSLDVPCFSDDFAKDLVVSAKATSVPTLATLVASPPAGGLVCKRCCSKKIVLKEKVKNYNCDGTPVSSTTLGTAECKFGRCLQMGAATLIKAEAFVTDASQSKTNSVIAGLPADSTPDTSATTMHRSVECTTIGGVGCTVTEKLGDMLGKRTNWQQEFTSKLSDHNADDIVYWRYKVKPTGSFAAWSNTDQLTFAQESTEITVQAWSLCGRVVEKKFTVVLHPHTDCDACSGFSAGWTNESPGKLTLDGNICAYPGSDFALMGFKSDSNNIFTEAANKHKCSMTNVVCTLAVAAEGASATTKQLVTAAPTSGRVLIDKKLAIELVKEAKTAKNTDVAIECVFSYQYYGSTETKTTTCPKTLRLTDCDGPTLQTYTSDLTCLDSTCGSPNGPPGAYETCDGDVFTTAEANSVVTTEKKTVSGTCCTGCSQTLSCKALPEASSIKRCEPPSTPTSLLALVTESNDQLVAAAPAEQSSVVTMLLSASAMVAVVALVAAKARVPTTKPQPVDDAYVSLLD